MVKTRTHRKWDMTEDKRYTPNITAVLDYIDPINDNYNTSELISLRRDLSKIYRLLVRSGFAYLKCYGKQRPGQVLKDTKGWKLDTSSLTGFVFLLDTSQSNGKFYDQLTQYIGNKKSSIIFAESLKRKIEELNKLGEKALNEVNWKEQGSEKQITEEKIKICRNIIAQNIESLDLQYDYSDMEEKLSQYQSRLDDIKKALNIRYPRFANKIYERGGLVGIGRTGFEKKMEEKLSELEELIRVKAYCDKRSSS